MSLPALSLHDVPASNRHILLDDIHTHPRAFADYLLGQDFVIDATVSAATQHGVVLQIEDVILGALPHPQVVLGFDPTRGKGAGTRLLMWGFGKALGGTRAGATPSSSQPMAG